jgi:serine/threonine protein kinase
VRAYYHAFRLNRLGISTPEPIAAIDVRRYGFLTQSFYVYAYSEYNDIKELLDRYPDEQIEPLLDALTDFILRIHDKGVLHNDLNILNILYRDCGSGKYDFQLIDINRMSFYPKLTERQRLANLRHFNCKPAVLMYILERYAAAMNIDCEMVQMRCVSMRFIDTIRHKFKQQLKSRFRR